MDERERRYAARRQLWDQAFRGIDFAGRRVLDAGTGEGHLTRYLAEQSPAELCSITCLSAEVEPARQRVGDLAHRVTFAIHDLVSMPKVPSDSFDIVAADYLIAAVAAYRPYREIDCLKELVRVLRPGGRLVVTGWEMGDGPRHPAERPLRQLFKIREAAHHLAGNEPFREHPAFWIRDRLTELGLPPERTTTLPDVHHDLGWLVASVRRAVGAVSDAELSALLSTRVDRWENSLHEAMGPSPSLTFGRLYAVVACKLTGGIVLDGRGR